MHCVAEICVLNAVYGDLLLPGWGVIVSLFGLVCWLVDLLVGVVFSYFGLPQVYTLLLVSLGTCLVLVLWWMWRFVWFCTCGFLVFGFD